MGPQILDSKIIFVGNNIQVKKDALLMSSGSTREYEYITRSDSSMIIAANKDHLFYLVKEYRHPARISFVQFPIETKEDNESYLKCAQRGLEEEVGIKANEWISLGAFFSDPGISAQQCQVFLAKYLNVSSTHSLKEEGIDILTLSKNEINDLLKSGVVDSWTIAAWQLYSIYLSNISK